jgi:hypothetical protein
MRPFHQIKNDRKTVINICDAYFVRDGAPRTNSRRWSFDVCWAEPIKITSWHLNVMPNLYEYLR